MGLRFIEKGDYILKRQDYEILKKVRNLSVDSVSVLNNALGPEKENPFREGFISKANDDTKKAVRFLDVLMEHLEGAK